jgi:uncharacterized membrane protein YvbJ
MALVKCTECGKEVSTDAVTCPHCGYPMRHMSKGIPAPRQRDELFLQGVNVGCAVILLIIGLFVYLMVVVFFNVSDRILEPEKKTQEQTVSKPE